MRAKETSDGSSLHGEVESFLRQWTSMTKPGGGASNGQFSSVEERPKEVPSKSSKTAFALAAISEVTSEPVRVGSLQWNAMDAGGNTLIWVVHQ